VVSVAKDHLTEQLINQSGRFILVIAGEAHRQLAMQVGSTKGESVNKFEKFSIAAKTAGPDGALIPQGAAAWMACEVESSQDIKGYRIFIGRVVDQHDTGRPPLVWQKDKYFGLKPV